MKIKAFLLPRKGWYGAFKPGLFDPAESVEPPYDVYAVRADSQFVRDYMNDKVELKLVVSVERLHSQISINGETLHRAMGDKSFREELVDHLHRECERLSKEIIDQMHNALREAVYQETNERIAKLIESLPGPGSVIKYNTGY